MRRKILAVALALTFVLSTVVAADTLRVGVMCALPKELGALQHEMDEPFIQTHRARREYVHGTLWGVDTVLVVGRVGKVAAATTATHLIESCDVDAIVFLGVAGAIAPYLHQGDIVIADRLVQHDLDSRPIIPRYAIPLLGVSEIHSDPNLVVASEKAAQDFASESFLFKWNPSVHVGLVGTGDRFVTSTHDKAALIADLPQLMAVDMEGGAVAQVCYEHEIPFVVIRAISDGCNEDSADTCMEFLNEHAPTYTREILRRLYQRLAHDRSFQFHHFNSSGS